ncbi:MAG: ATP-binding protein [Desulfatiglandales bacterium]
MNEHEYKSESARSSSSKGRLIRASRCVQRKRSLPLESTGGPSLQALPCGPHPSEETAPAEDSPVICDEFLQELETSYTEVFTAAPVGLALTSPQGRIIMCNPALEQTCGYTREELLSLCIWDFYLEPARRRELVQVLGRKGFVRDFTAALIRKDGSRFTGRISMAPVYRKGQKVFMTVLLDISEEVEAKKALKDARKALADSREQLNQAQKMGALGVLLAGVAHEINNPVNQIMFNTPLLQRIWRDLEPEIAARSFEDPEKTFGGLTPDFLCENIPQLLANMETAAIRIAKFVSDLKQFSRYSTVNDKQSVQLNTAVTNAVRLAQSSIKKAGANLSLDLDEHLPLMRGNLQKLEQISLNLLINAVQAMEGHPGDVQIRTRTASDGGLVLSVSDTGKGIPEEVAERIFDPFVTNRQGQGGTGLGLSVTQSLVKAHGGDIRFDTREGMGTTFYVWLPSLPDSTPKEGL